MVLGKLLEQEHALLTNLGKQYTKNICIKLDVIIFLQAPVINPAFNKMAIL